MYQYLFPQGHPGLCKVCLSHGASHNHNMMELRLYFLLWSAGHIEAEKPKWASKISLKVQKAGGGLIELLTCSYVPKLSRFF